MEKQLRHLKTRIVIVVLGCLLAIGLSFYYSANPYVRKGRTARAIESILEWPQSAKAIYSLRKEPDLPLLLATAFCIATVLGAVFITGIRYDTTRKGRKHANRRH